MRSPTTSPSAERRPASREDHEAKLRALERALPAHGYGDAALADYQQACRDYAARVASQDDDDRHHFLVIIPTADRPRQLRECLASLLDLCRLYGYGGHDGTRYRKVAAMIADDSKHAESIAAHRALAREFAALGLEMAYFGLEEQLAVVDRLPDEARRRLAGILGRPDREAFYHKGHSVMRNILYLNLHARYADDDRQLFWFADSDQEFRVKVGGADGDRDVYALDYFRHLDRHFRDHDIELLTGKVVGDPPVSPAVMAGNFLADVQAFLEQAGGLQPQAPCPFHDHALPTGDSAAYHDMAGLFGFAHDETTHRYRCTLPGPHTLADGIGDFTRRLARFFDGEHPTRITYFDMDDALYGDGRPVRPARTVYTGNYVIRADALRRFVPFAPLRLRMSGPTFGRLLQGEIGARFVSANLPMLHKRTEPESGASEFRPGVVRQAQRIDLSNEFERQFFGDVMLFSVEQLASMGYPVRAVEEGVIADTLRETAGRMADLYREKHARILSSLDALQALRGDLGRRLAGLSEAWARLDAFLANMHHNFGLQAEGYRLIAHPGHRQRRHAQLLAALIDYRADRAAWGAALSAMS